MTPGPRRRELTLRLCIERVVHTTPEREPATRDAGHRLVLWYDASWARCLGALRLRWRGVSGDADEHPSGQGGADGPGDPQPRAAPDLRSEQPARVPDGWQIVKVLVREWFSRVRERDRGGLAVPALAPVLLAIMGRSDEHDGKRALNLLDHSISIIRGRTHRSVNQASGPYCAGK
jgi:hypothetical protein